MAYYKINPLVLFRNYGDFGYITDNRNFGYNFTGTNFILGDQIVSETAILRKQRRYCMKVKNNDCDK